MRVAVMGSGAWGTVISQVLADAGSEVTLWARDPELAHTIDSEHINPSRLPHHHIPASIRATSDAATALSGAEIVFIALPSHAYREYLAQWAALISHEAVVVSLAKGIEIGSNLRMSEVVAQVTGIAPARIAVLSGPNLAHEIAHREPTATTIACSNERNAELVQSACANEYFRPYYTTDTLGVEIAGAMKNVIALANGIAVGMKLGENSQASLITRGLHEMTVLGRALGARPETFLGLAGVGDLLATSQSPLSRNRSFGFDLAQKGNVQEVIASTRGTCEAVKSCMPLWELGRSHNVELPITAGVVAVVHKGLAPQELLNRFMKRAVKSETAQEAG